MKDMNTKYKKPVEKDQKLKGSLQKIGHKASKVKDPPLGRTAPERQAKGGPKTPGKPPGKRMSTVAKVANRGIR